MTLNKDEKMLAEAIKNMLDDTALGVDAHKDAGEERAHTFTFLHEEIEQAFRLEAIDLEHHDDVCSAFSKIHSHKYLDDPSFALSFKKELSARAVPLEEQEAALKVMGKVIDKLLAEKNEKDEGWNPDLDEIIKASQPQQIEESVEHPNYGQEREFYTDPKVRKWIKGKEKFWEAVDKRIKPQLVQLGYDCKTPETFWEAYDDDIVGQFINPRMHELFEELNAEFQTVG